MKQSPGTAILPLIVIKMYEQGIFLQTKQSDDSYLQYPIDPDAFANAVGAKQTISSGLILEDTLSITRQGNVSTVISYRAPSMEGLWLDGYADPFRIPLPPLIMKRTSTFDKYTNKATYSMWAVHERPTSEDALLYRAPFPNVGASGSCWGNVQRPPVENHSMKEDWASWLGTRFGSHACKGASEKYPDDIRLMWKHLSDSQMGEYPLADLIPIGKTLAWAIGG